MNGQKVPGHENGRFDASDKNLTEKLNMGHLNFQNFFLLRNENFTAS